MAKGLSSPNILLASSNPVKMIVNISHLIEATEVAKLTAEIDRNVRLLYELGNSHFIFAKAQSNSEWRQKISRSYYAAYNVRRALMLKYNGHFSTESIDHKTVDELPSDLNHRDSHIVQLRALREDRNLADYSHLAQASDLVIQPDDALAFVHEFIKNCGDYLVNKGTPL